MKHIHLFARVRKKPENSLQLSSFLRLWRRPKEAHL